MVSVAPAHGAQETLHRRACDGDRRARRGGVANADVGIRRDPRPKGLAGGRAGGQGVNRQQVDLGAGGQIKG